MKNNFFKINKKSFIKNMSNIIEKNIDDYYVLSSPFLFKSKLRSSNEVYPKDINFFFQIILIFVKTFLNIIRRFKKKKIYINKKKKLNIENIFISHLTISDNDSNEIKDNYFGDIPKILKKNNLIIYIPHNIKKLSPFIKKKITTKNDNILIIDRHEEYFKDLLKIFIFFYKSIFLLLNSYKSNDHYESWFLKELSLSLVSESSLQTISDVNNIRKIINILSFKKIIIPFEGFSWERILINDLKKTKKNIEIFGYINYGLFENQFSLNYNQNSKIYPDYLLTSGQIINNFLQSKKLLNKNKIFNIGSNRFDFNILKRFNISTYKKRIGILLILEALETEIYKFLEFAKSLDSKKLNFNIYIKFHPLTNIKIYEKILNQFSNIKIFTEKDYNQIKYAIFRGSTGIISAIKNGAIPLYFNSYSEINLNPIFFYFNNRLEFNDIDEFIKLDNNFSSLFKKIDLKEIHNKSNLYYEPIKKLKIIELLSK